MAATKRSPGGRERKEREKCEPGQVPIRKHRRAFL